jgi:hypothetical protein
MPPTVDVRRRDSAALPIALMRGIARAAKRRAQHMPTGRHGLALATAERVRARTRAQTLPRITATGQRLHRQIRGGVPGTRMVTAHINRQHARTLRVIRMRRHITIVKAAARTKRPLLRALTQHRRHAVIPHRLIRLLLVRTRHHHRAVTPRLHVRTLRQAAAMVVAVVAVMAEGAAVRAAAAAAVVRMAAALTEMALTAALTDTEL